MSEIVEEIKRFVEEECRKPSAKYDYDVVIFHIQPVVNYALLLAKNKDVDLEVLELAAWLHDIGSIIYGREDHHITGCEIADGKLRELGCRGDKIEKVKHCIFSHRGSRDIPRESVEAQILADADVISHFDAVPGLFRACYLFEGVKGQGEAGKSVKTKLINSYNKLSEDAKKIIKPKFDAAMLLLEGESD